MAATFWEYANTSTFLESLVDVSVHFLLIDKRQGLVGDSFAVGVLDCLTKTSSAFPVLSAKLFFLLSVLYQK